MKHTLAILVSSLLVNNMVLVKFLGLCPLMGVSRRQNAALGMGLATTFVLTLSAVLSQAVDAYLLKPLGADYLRTIAFIVVIASVVQLAEQIIRKVQPLLHQVLGIYLPLITTNCAVLGVALLNTQSDNSMLDAFAYGLGSALGFSLVLFLFAGLRERLEAADVPRPFRGHAIGLITAGLVSVAFMGFAGLVRV
jgi:electron transport complex protein RnfA